MGFSLIANNLDEILMPECNYNGVYLHDFCAPHYFLQIKIFKWEHLWLWPVMNLMRETCLLIEVWFTHESWHNKIRTFRIGAVLKIAPKPITFNIGFFRKTFHINFFTG